MVPDIDRRHLRNITFPLYLLPSDEVEYRDGLVILEGKVIDDKNMPGDTLGKRRLQTPHAKFRLKKSVNNVAEMLACAWLLFIDYKGNTFKYNKTMFGRLQYKRISKIESKDTYSLLYVTGVNSPFLLKRPPQAGEEWVGILYVFDHPWVIYELSETYKPPSKKKF